MEMLAWLEDTDLSVWLRESDWGHPIVLCFHAVGMALVVGVSVMFSARVLGYSKNFPLSAFDALFGLAWFGFAINAVSGVLLFVGEPRRLLATPAFLIKMVLIVFAGFSLWVLGKTLENAMRVPVTTAPATDAVGVAVSPDVVSSDGVLLNAKIAAILPIVFWLGAIVSGRLIGYTIGPPPI